ARGETESCRSSGGAHEMSERRACKAIGCCRMTMRYWTTRTDDASLRQRMRAIAQERRRFGYRRLHVLLRREGYLINHKKLFRLYREEMRSSEVVFDVEAALVLEGFHCSITVTIAKLGPL